MLDHGLFHESNELNAFENAGIPCVLHNGQIEMHGSPDATNVVPPPVTADVLVAAVARVVRKRG